MRGESKNVDWADVNARVNIAGALILIVILLSVVAYKLTI